MFTDIFQRIRINIGRIIKPLISPRIERGLRAISSGVLPFILCRKPILEMIALRAPLGESVRIVERDARHGPLLLTAARLTVSPVAWQRAFGLAGKLLILGISYFGLGHPESLDADLARRILA